MLCSMFCLDHNGGVCSITLSAVDSPVDSPVVGLSVNSQIVKKEATFLH